MYWIDVRRDDLTFPPDCCCCLLPTQALRDLTARQSVWQFMGLIPVTRTVAVPYCPDCTRHASWHELGGTAGLLLRPFVAFIVAFLVAIVPNQVVWAILGLKSPAFMAWAPSVLVAAVLAGVVFRRHLARRPTSAADRPHTRARDAVELVAFHGPLVRLAVHNDAFARQTLDRSPGARVIPADLAEPVPPRSGQLALLVLAIVILFFAIRFLLSGGIQ
jgi:hypothetical protein